MFIPFSIAKEVPVLLDCYHRGLPLTPVEWESFLNDSWGRDMLDARGWRSLMTPDECPANAQSSACGANE